MRKSQYEIESKIIYWSQVNKGYLMRNITDLKNKPRNEIKK